MVEKKTTTATAKTATKTTAKRTSTRTTTAKKSVVYVNGENAGFRAGDIYQVLNTEGKALTLAEVAKKAKIAENDALLGLGWLLREGKVASTEDNKIVLA